ncbi:MAG: fused MFS/spermidine synthase [Thermoguttaceae bacterium]|jgi:spermidine synthase|nr:fused MFS/spermidine synthase [Thermoguttaceae bacterium]
MDLDSKIGLGPGRHRIAWLVAASLALCLVLPRATGGHVRAEPLRTNALGEIELDVKSDYSRILVRKAGNVRTLLFVRDSGEEAAQSQMDLAHPHELRFVYLRYMFLSYAFRPKQEHVLIVGLGGGSMIHFLKRYDPGVKIDVVEIDPVVVRIAGEFFGVRSGGNVHVITADAVDYLADTPSRYDVIYLDAFLKPSGDTDSTGVPLRLRTVRFYQSVQRKLRPGGLVVFNLNPHPGLAEDIETIRAAFPQVYVFRLPANEGAVVVASTAEERVPRSVVLERAAELDRRFRASFSFQSMARRLAR